MGAATGVVVVGGGGGVVVVGGVVVGVIVVGGKLMMPNMESQMLWSTDIRDYDKLVIIL